MEISIFPHTPLAVLNQNGIFATVHFVAAANIPESDLEENLKIEAKDGNNESRLIAQHKKNYTFSRSVINNNNERDVSAR